jgi:hypothetical protein
MAAGEIAYSAVLSITSTGEAIRCGLENDRFSDSKRVNFGSSMQELQSGNDGEKVQFLRQLLGGSWLLVIP